MKRSSGALGWVALALALACAPREAGAQVPQTLVHQGRLLTPAGAAVTGMLMVTYRIYDAPTGGMALWSETHSLTFDDGYFSVALGSMSMFPSTLFNGRPRFLGVTVGTDPEMTPRELVASVPYALMAGDVTGDIHPASVSVGGRTVIDAMGRWVGGSMGGSEAFSGCPEGLLMSGVCVAHIDNSTGTDWNSAASTCAGFRSDLCTATQYLAVRDDQYGGGRNLFLGASGRRTPIWSAHFSDNDADRLGFILRTADDPTISNMYGFACCVNNTPPEFRARGFLVPAMGMTDRGILVTYLNNREETHLQTAVSICTSLRSDLCSTAQYVTLNDAGRFGATVRRLANNLSDDDSERFDPILGTNTSDNPSLSDNWAFACCASQRSSDPSCPGGMNLNNVCVVELHTTEDSSFIEAARACARRGADICTNSQMQGIRNAGRFAAVRAWTNNGADNDSNRVGGLLSSMPDDPNPVTDRFGYACCQ
ncbi:MAG: hypothetical protein HY909_13445 [Deltaproteobacteria bacterium]|nr:hypothetical protein [Deltaproteobacteria bacterium]